MSDHEFDLFVIGGGSGGVRAARIAAAHGAKVAMAEEFRVGGTCVIRGCVPKKLLVYGAHFAEDLKDAKRFGWQVPECAFDWTVLRDHVLADVDRLEGLYQNTLDSHGVTSFHQRATVTGANEIEPPTWMIMSGTAARTPAMSSLNFDRRLEPLPSSSRTCRCRTVAPAL